MAEPNPVPNQPGGNPLEDVIPVSQRKRVYGIFALAALLATVVQAAVLMTNTDGHEPMWLKVTILCFNLLSAPVYAMSHANAKVGP